MSNPKMSSTPILMKTLFMKAFFLVFLLIIASNNSFSQNNSNEDDRIKIRLGFTSVNNLHRQILVTVDENATSGIDFGYDAENFENHIDDMYWMVDNRKFLIQGTNIIDETIVLKLGLHTGTDGYNTISVVDLINIPENLSIGILDKETNTYYNFKQSDSFSIYLEAGEYLNRFELNFSNQDTNENNNSEDESDDNEDESTNDASDEDNTPEVETVLNDEIIKEEATIKYSFINSSNSISIKNIGKRTIRSVNIFNITGQLIKQFRNIKVVNNAALIPVDNINSGNYIIILNTDSERLSKKVIIK